MFSCSGYHQLPENGSGVCPLVIEPGKRSAAVPARAWTAPTPCRIVAEPLAGQVGAVVGGTRKTDRDRSQSVSRFRMTGRCWTLALGRGVSAATALGLAALGAVLFLHTDKAQPATMLANDARSFNTLIEATEELIEALSITDFSPHAFLITPPQGVFRQIVNSPDGITEQV